MTEENNAAAAPQTSPETCSATDALKRAKAELEKAQAFYDSLCKQAAEKAKAVRETSVGDIIDGTLETVKKHPAAGLTLAALLGFFLGRLFRR